MHPFGSKLLAEAHQCQETVFSAGPELAPCDRHQANHHPSRTCSFSVLELVSSPIGKVKVRRT